MLYFSISELLKIEIVNDELIIRLKTQNLGYLNSSMECFNEECSHKNSVLVEKIGDGYNKIADCNKELHCRPVKIYEH